MHLARWLNRRGSNWQLTKNWLTHPIIAGGQGFSILKLYWKFNVPAEMHFTEKRFHLINRF
jgi:hypothetical protein